MFDEIAGGPRFGKGPVVGTRKVAEGACDFNDRELDVPTACAGRGGGGIRVWESFCFLEPSVFVATI